MAASAPPQPDERAIREGLEMLVAEGAVVEVRALNVGRDGRTLTGYYDDLDAAARDAAAIEGATGVYYTLNPPRVDLLGRGPMHAAPRGGTTADTDIERRLLILIDVDSVRPKGIPATADELAAARELAEQVMEWLRERGWPEPILVCSGNGYQILIGCDLPADDGGLVAYLLAALAQRFDTEQASIDTSVSNAARIARLPGTVNRKGEATAERPHRLARIVSAPEELAAVSPEQVEAVIAEAGGDLDARGDDPGANDLDARGDDPGSRFDLAAWVAKHLPQATGPQPWSAQGGIGQRWQVTCPFESHAKDRGKAWVGQLASGAISAGCQAERCQWGWAELRERFDPVAERLTPTDTGNAARFARQWAGRLLYVADSGQWLRWDGCCWREAVRADLDAAAKETAREMLRAAADIASDDERRAAVKWSMTSLDLKRLRAMVELAGSEPALVCRVTDLDRDPWLLATANGMTIDLRTGESRESRPGDRITRCSPVSWDPQATAPRWQQFLGEVFAERADLIAFVHRAAGYSLTGDTSAQVFFLCHGAGSNGKGVMMTALREVAGSYSVAAAIDTFMQRKHHDGSAASPDVARLRGARLVSASEGEQGQRLATARVKEMTGQDPLTARHLHREPFTFVPHFKLWLSTNHRPVITDTTESIWRRVKLIPFEVTFDGDRRDDGLAERLRAELPGILVWMVRGAVAWYQAGGGLRGLGQCAEVEAAVAEYRSESNHVQRFAQECLVRRDGGWIPSSQMHARYQQWQADDGDAPAMTSTQLGEALGKLGSGPVRRNRGRGYEGLALAPGAF